MGVELEDGLVEEGLSKWVTAPTEQGISRCVELVLQIRQVHVALVVRDVVLGNFMGRLIIEILKRVDLRGVVEQILAVLAAVEIEGRRRFGLLACGLHSRLAQLVLRSARYPRHRDRAARGMFSINSVRTAEAFQGIGILPNIVALNADFAPGANEVVPDARAGVACADWEWSDANRGRRDICLDRRVQNAPGRTSFG